MKKYLQLNDLDCYKRSFHLSNFVWKKIILWDSFSRNAMGLQYVRAVDSISPNITEGFGRYKKKDKIKFFYYSQGSLKESLDWNEKAKIRSLLKRADNDFTFSELQLLPKEINSLILNTNFKLKQ